MLSSAPDSLVDLKAHAESIGVIYPTYFDCTVPGGQLSGRDMAPITAYARSQGIAVLPRFNCQDGPTVHRILTDPAMRAATIARLSSIGADPRYRGLCLDLENDGAGDRTALSTFVAEVARLLHAHHRRLTVVVDGVTSDNPRISTGFYDDRYLGAVADSVFVLAWGTHWAGSPPGPIAPLPFVAQVARYVASLPNARRFVLGAAMYGLDWPEEEVLGGAHALEYSGVLALIHSVGAAPHRDGPSGEMTFGYTSAEGVAHSVWYLDAGAVAAVLRIAQAHGLGVGLWRLGAEDQALWRSSAIRRLL